MPGDLILEARLELLRDNLERARDVPIMLENQHEGLAELLDTLKTGRGVERSSLVELSGLTVKLQIAQVHLNNLAQDPAFEEPLTEARDGLTSALAIAEKLRAKLTRAAEIAARLHDRRVAAAENLSGGAGWSELRAVAHECIKKVQPLLQRNGQAPPTQDAVWRTYAEVLETMGPRFDECVDLLQGVSVREHGLEDNSAALFELADTIIKPWRVPEFNADSFTIPSRRVIEPRRALEPRARMSMLRVGFSEWSLWTLPLVAFEFGRLAVDRSRRIKEFLVARHVDDLEAWEELIADGLATTALGPAYACAAVFLRLRPPWPGDPADHDRYRMITLTLAALNTGHAFDHVIAALESAWKVASREADWSALPALRSDADLREAVEFLREQAETTILLSYPVAEVQRAESIADKLRRQRKGEAVEVDLQTIGDSRNLMNLAWLWRIEEPEARADIAEKVLGLWAGLQTTQRRAALGGLRGPRAAGISQQGGRP